MCSPLNDSWSSPHFQLHCHSTFIVHSLRSCLKFTKPLTSGPSAFWIESRSLIPQECRTGERTAAKRNAHVQPPFRAGVSTFFPFYLCVYKLDMETKVKLDSLRSCRQIFLSVVYCWPSYDCRCTQGENPERNPYCRFREGLGAGGLPPSPSTRPPARHTHTHTTHTHTHTHTHTPHTHTHTHTHTQSFSQAAIL